MEKLNLQDHEIANYQTLLWIHPDRVSITSCGSQVHEHSGFRPRPYGDSGWDSNCTGPILVLFPGVTLPIGYPAGVCQERGNPLLLTETRKTD